MSVLIKGMEMPTNCAWCRFLQSTDPIPKRELFCGIDTTNNIHDYKPDKGCPLVPVPSHGRCIDADAFLAEQRHLYCENCGRRKGMKNGKMKFVYDIGDAPCRACGYGDVLDDIDDAPTIIEAEGEKDMIPWIFADLDTIIDCYSEPPEEGET